MNGIARKYFADSLKITLSFNNGTWWQDLEFWHDQDRLCQKMRVQEDGKEVRSTRYRMPIGDFNWFHDFHVIPNVFVSWVWFGSPTWWIEMTNKDQIHMEGLLLDWIVIIVTLCSCKVDDVSLICRTVPTSKGDGIGWMPSEVRVRDEGDHLQTRRRGPKTNLEWWWWWW
jgi:hypothetical protein